VGCSRRPRAAGNLVGRARRAAPARLSLERGPRGDRSLSAADAAFVRGAEAAAVFIHPDVQEGHEGYSEFSITLGVPSPATARREKRPGRLSQMDWLCGLSGRLPDVKSSRRNTALCRRSPAKHTFLVARACRKSGFLPALVLWRVRRPGCARIVRSVRARACRLREHVGGSGVRWCVTPAAPSSEKLPGAGAEHETGGHRTVPRGSAAAPRTNTTGGASHRMGHCP
jgi:hypothetical protein